MNFSNELQAETFFAAIVKQKRTVSPGLENGFGQALGTRARKIVQNKNSFAYA